MQIYTTLGSTNNDFNLYLVFRNNYVESEPKSESSESYGMENNFIVAFAPGNRYIYIYIVFVKRIKDEGAVKMHYICFRTCNQIVKLKQQLEIIQNSSDIIKNKDFEYMVEKHRSIC